MIEGENYRLELENAPSLDLGDVLREQAALLRLQGLHTVANVLEREGNKLSKVLEIETDTPPRDHC